MPEVPLLQADARIEAARSHWRFRGQQRPDFAEVPGPGEESVWDFPRPPRIEAVQARMQVFCAGELVADTLRGRRVLETAGAPTYYFPPEDLIIEPEPEPGGSLCEWKGVAEPLKILGRQGAAWRYVQMFPEFAGLYRWVAFYPGVLDCFVGDEQVEPQPGGYYGGWVTSNLTGPIKGESGSSHW